MFLYSSFREVFDIVSDQGGEFCKVDHFVVAFEVLEFAEEEAYVVLQEVALELAEEGLHLVELHTLLVVEEHRQQVVDQHVRVHLHVVHYVLHCVAELLVTNPVSLLI